MLLLENREAWELYREWLNNRFVQDFSALPLVFDMLGLKKTRPEAKALLKKLIVIHGVITAGKKDEA